MRPVSRRNLLTGFMNVAATAFGAVLLSCAENLHPPIRLFPAAARYQVVACGHLVLEPSDICVGGSEFCRCQAFVEDLVNGIFGL